jgi:GWxTD domain-containing protein
MKMKYISTVILPVLFIAVGLSAQQNFIPFQSDYAAFLGSEGKSYTEVYTALFQSELSYAPEEDSVKVAHFEHTVEIYQGDSLIDQRERTYKNTLGLDAKPQLLSQFMDVFSFELVPGYYKLVVTLTDQVSGKSGVFNIEMEIPDFSGGLKISHLEIATQAAKAAKPSNFSNKNNIEIYPNPSRVFGIIYPVLYFYFEAYNLKMGSDGKTIYSYHYYITDPNGNIVRDFPVKTRTRTSTTIAEANGTNVIALASGTYFLNVDLIDQIAQDTTRSQSNFLVKKLERNKEGSLIVQEDPAAIYSTFSEEQLIDEFKKARYIATSEEKDVFDELDSPSMRRFLAGFWKRRDPNPETAVNEYKKEYLERAELSDLRFSTSFRAGWKSDRGRVLLIYGKPDEIERNPSTIDSQPYETWYYYTLDGGSQFIFGDLSGHGEYELLHSTYRNELQDPNWRARLGGQSSFDTGF